MSTSKIYKTPYKDSAPKAKDPNFVPKMKFTTDLQYLKGVGPKLASLFAKKGIHTVGDLLHLYPRAFEDRRAVRQIAGLKVDEIVSLQAQIVKVTSIGMGRSTRKIYDISIKDSSGIIHCKYFRVPYKGYFDRFQPGMLVRITGKVTLYRNKLEFHHPDIKEAETEEEITDQLIPIYSEIEGLSSAKIKLLIQRVFEQLPLESWPQDLIPKWILKDLSLLTHKEALKLIHFPNADFANEYHDSKNQGS